MLGVNNPMLADTASPGRMSATEAANVYKAENVGEAAKAKLHSIVEGQEQLIQDIKTVSRMLPTILSDEQAFALHRLIDFCVGKL